MREAALGWPGKGAGLRVKSQCHFYFGLGFGSLFAKKKGHANEFQLNSKRKIKDRFGETF